MTDLHAQIAAMRARVDAATAGPWEEIRNHHECYVPIGEQCDHHESPITERTVYRVADGDSEDAEHHTHESFEVHYIGPNVAGNFDYEEGGIIRTEDATFIAHARTDLPRLLDAVEAVVAYCQLHENDVPVDVDGDTYAVGHNDAVRDILSALTGALSGKGGGE